MSIIVLLVILVCLALALFAVQAYLPNAGAAPGSPTIKNIICLVLVALAIVTLLVFAGVIPASRLH